MATLKVRHAQGSWWAWIIGVGVSGAVACSGTGTDISEGDPGVSTEALDATQVRVLGFETPLSDWSRPGGAIAVGTPAADGSAALSVIPNGWTVVSSRTLSSLGAVGNSLSIKVRVPALLPAWGEARLVLESPSRGLVWAELGSRSLVGLAPNVYHTLTFPLSSTVRAALSGTYSDLVIRIVINAPTLSTGYRIDSLAFAAPGSGSGGTGGTGGTAGKGGTAGTGGTAGAGGSSSGVFTVNAEIQPARDVIFQNLAIVASNKIDIEDRASIVSPGGGFAPISNTGAQKTTIGSNANTGSTYSVGNVFLREDAYVHGDVVTAGALETQTEWTIDGVTRQGVTVPSTTVRRSATFSNVVLAAVSVDPGQTLATPVAPGRYGALNLKEGARAKLVSGNYWFGAVHLEPSSTLEIDDSAGPVVVFADQALNLKGVYTYPAGQQPKLLFIYLGANEAFVPTAFRGTIWAPNGTVNLEGPVGTHHEGVFAGKNVRVAPDVQVVHRPMPILITSVTVDKSDICQSESVKVSVGAADPNNPSTPVKIYISGVLTNDYSDQFEGAPGPRAFAITAVAADGTTETTRKTVNVIACDTATTVRPLLYGEENVYKRGFVNFTVRNAIDFEDGSESYAWDFGDGTTVVTAEPVATHDYSDALGISLESQKFDVAVTVTRPGLDPASARRSFRIHNSYVLTKRRGSIEPPHVLTSPVVEADGTDWVGEAQITNRETSDLAFTQRRLAFMPCNVAAAPVDGSSSTVALTIPANTSAPYELRLPQAQVPAGTCGIDVHLTGATTAGTPAVTHFMLEVPAAFGTGPTVSEGLANLLNYLVEQGLVANPRAITEEEVLELYRRRKIPSSAVEAFLQAAPPAVGERCDPDNPGPAPETGYSCQPTGTWSTDSAQWIDSANPEFEPQAHVANAQTGDVILVRGCSGAVRPILQAVDQIFTHSGMMTKNFYEIRHSTGDDGWLQNHPNGVAGQPTDGFEEHALRFVWPGTITATVEEAFAKGKQATTPEGDTRDVRGFQRSEVRCTGDSNIVHPVVIKPPPQSQIATRPALEAAAAGGKDVHGHYRFSVYSNAPDTATNDPNGPDSVLGPDGNTQTYGKVPTVCSSFVRSAAKTSVSTLDQDKTFPVPSDVTNGPPDGIFFYSKERRLAAGEALFDHLHNEVWRTLGATEAEVDDYWWASGGAGYLLGGPVGAAIGLGVGQELGDFAEFFTDAADDVANQITNCFASDFCSEDAKDSDAWRNPGNGFAVSPDDIMNHYDSPATGGLYGYQEPMIYRGKRFRPIFQWLASEGTRTIAGTVVKQTFGVTSPVEEANVTIMGFTDKQALTDASGNFAIDAVPSGNLQIHASKLIDGVFVEADSCYTPHPTVEEALQWVNCSDFTPIDDVAYTEVTLTLIAPSEDFRKVTISGSILVEDCDCCGGYETCPERAVRNFFRVCHVSPIEPTSGFGVGPGDLCMDEVGIGIEGTCELIPGTHSVKVSGTVKLFEAGGGSCGGGELEDSTTFERTIGQGQNLDISANVVANDGFCTAPFPPVPFDCDDRGQFFEFKAENARAD